MDCLCNQVGVGWVLGVALWIVSVDARLMFGCYRLGIGGNHGVGCCWVIGWLN